MEALRSSTGAWSSREKSAGSLVQGTHPEYCQQSTLPVQGMSVVEHSCISIRLSFYLGDPTKSNYRLLEFLVMKNSGTGSRTQFQNGSSASVHFACFSPLVKPSVSL